MSESFQNCSRCGAAFHCGMASGAEPCWCAAMPKVVSVPRELPGVGCWCPACLKAEIEKRANGAAKTPTITTIPADVES